MASEEIIQELVDVLTDAKEHLDYCGYGDSWERECAKASKLEEKIDAALKGGKEWLDKV